MKSNLTKKDYDLIGKSIRQVYDNTVNGEYGNQMKAMGAFHVAHNLANRLSKIDPTFDQDKFLSSCGLCVIVRADIQNHPNTDWICKTHKYHMSYTESRRPIKCPNRGN